MEIKLTWIDSNTQIEKQPILNTPVAIGKEFDAMPSEIDNIRVSRMVISDDSIANYHVLITENHQDLLISDESGYGLQINGMQVNQGRLLDGSKLQIGNCQITITILSSTTGECENMVGFLFKRRCGRINRNGCEYCQNPNYENPYYYDYSYYEGYSNYDRGYWGDRYYLNREQYHYNPDTGNVDFTEADAIAFAEEREGFFETNMGES